VSPPPLGRGRKRASQTFDAALGDAELVSARSALAQGRWQEVRSLLTRTGEDWDRRGHRITVLALESGTAAWAAEWQLAEPDSADAAVLHAAGLVRRVLDGRAKAPKAREACRKAAALMPQDPTPWFCLLLLERTVGSEADVVRLFDEVRHRHPEHHHAHHLMVARLAERRAETGQEPLHEVYDFADWAAEQASPGSQLAVLPVVAHAERYRVLAQAGLESSDPVASGHWIGRRARQALKSAFDWWLEWERDDHPRHYVDLNYLAHAKHCEGRSAEAAALFLRIGPNCVQEPWAYPARDPVQAFRAARLSALGSE
jgi:hypothetical protein